MTVDELLQHAPAIVRRRRRTYGEPAVLFERAAVRWSQVLGTRITPAQVVLCLIELKLARLAHDPRHLDSMLDVIGYTACLQELTRDA
jgi:hypothetical protein